MLSNFYPKLLDKAILCMNSIEGCNYGIKLSYRGRLLRGVQVLPGSAVMICEIIKDSKANNFIYEIIIIYGLRFIRHV